MSLNSYIEKIGFQAKQATALIASAKPEAKSKALLYLAQLLENHKDAILEANNRDMEAAKKNGLSQVKLERLLIDDKIIADMAFACREVAAMPDVIGAMDKQWQQKNGLLIGKMRIPLGIIAIIYESRPNVTVDASILCLKAGNGVILRGGSEALFSNLYLAGLIRKALAENNLPENAMQLIETTDREAVPELCKLNSCIDVIIPRGGDELIRLVSRLATMPVLKHDKGVCHMFIDESANLNQISALVENSKVQKPSACNALECLLIHKNIANILPELAQGLLNKNVELRACEKSMTLLPKNIKIKAAIPSDFGQEFGDLILAIKIVDNLDQALDHIHNYGSKHTEIICSNNQAHISRFLREADASVTGANASTRFNDGSQLGLGAEIGISTSKLHAFGPMGVQELTTTKFVIMGEGQIR